MLGLVSGMKLKMYSIFKEMESISKISLFLNRIDATSAIPMPRASSHASRHQQSVPGYAALHFHS